MRNICFFNTIRFWGGGEKLHFEYGQAFARRGYRVLFAADERGALAQKGKEAGMEVADQRVRNLSFLNPVKILRLTIFFRRHKIDTVFFSSSQDFKAAGLAARLAGVPRIVYLRGLAVPIKNNLVNGFLLRRVMTHLLANSEETARLMRKDFGEDFPLEKLHVIYHGIDLEAYDLLPVSKVIPRSGQEVIIGNAGRLTEQKGQKYLLEVAGILKNKGLEVKFFVAVTGELEATLKQEARERGLEAQVQFMGFVEDMKSFMAGIDIFALTSLWEGFGYVLVEAMACGKPVVAFEVSSNPEIVSAGISGLLVECRNPQAFAESLERLIQDAGLCKEMGENARHWVETNFQLEDKISEVEAVLLSGSASE